MKCEKCGINEGFIWYKDFLEDKEVKICRKCAREEGIIMDEDTEDIKEFNDSQVKITLL